MEDYTRFLNKNSIPIFLFHGVYKKKLNYKIRNYNKKHIDKDYFYTVCSKLKKAGHALSMDDIYKTIIKKKPFLPYSFGITFDDGFFNNYSVAAPILRDLNLPSTFYVTTNFIDKNYMVWADRLERVLEDTSKSLVQVPWGSFKVLTNNDKIKFLNNLRKVFKSDPKYDADNITNNIIDQLNKKIKYTGESDIDKKMSWKNIISLNSEDIFTIAPHSHNHKILSFCNDENLKTEIKKSISLLKNKTKIKNFHYAYPDGQVNHYNKKVIKVLKDNGVKCCPSAISGLNNLKTNLFDLKRIMVT